MLVKVRNIKSYENKFSGLGLATCEERERQIDTRTDMVKVMANFWISSPASVLEIA
jgi:hypothetical protein